ncbi:MAG: helix-turn-helix domain-containing protein [Ilumatobacteraceae bacterium]
MSADESVLAFDGRRARRERNAARLYDSANELLTVRGFDELSVEEICEHAGVGRATFFRIYETKAGLLREFNRRLADDAAARVAAAGDKVDLRTGLDQIRAAIVDAWRHAGQGHAGMAATYLASVPSGSPHAAHPELLALVARRIKLGIDSGTIVDTVPIDIAASLLLLSLVAPVAHAIDGHDVDIDELSRVLLDQWLAGMKPSRRRRTAR